MILQQYLYQIVATVIAVVVFIILRYLVDSIIGKFGKKADFGESCTQLVKKYIDYFIYALAVLTLVSIWGIKSEQIFLFVSSVLTVIGVTFLAQWSILNNITIGIIIFFSSPFRIGNTIRFVDKEFPIEARIIDIGSFYTLLKAAKGEEITLPDNPLLQKGIIIITQQS